MPRDLFVPDDAVLGYDPVVAPPPLTGPGDVPGLTALTWTPATLLSPWINRTQTTGFFTDQYVAAYSKNALSIVRLRGLISSPSTAPSANTGIFDLPVGSRPSATLQIPVATDTGFGYLIVNSAGSSPGRVFWAAGSGSGGWIDISSISFVAEE